MSSCKARHFCRLYGEHWNSERCILGGWMRMGLQNWVISRLWCILGCWYRMGWLTCVVQHGELFRQSSKQGCVRWKKSDLKFVVCRGTLVQDGLAHMRGVTWRAVPAKFKTDVWDENLAVWGFVMYLWEVGSGWVGTNAWCNLESCYLKKFFSGYGNVESFGICDTNNKALIRCGSGSWVGWKGCGWPFSGEVLNL